MVVKNFKFIHWVFISITLFTVATPAKASLAQVVLLVANFIETNIAGFSGVIRQLSAGAQSQANALQMSTEVIGGTIAEQTKSLGKLEYKLQFGQFGSLGSVRINSVAPGGCLSKKRELNFKKYALLVDETNESVLPEINSYSTPVLGYDRDEDIAARKNTLDRMEASDFPLEGLFINENISLDQRDLWAEFVKHVTTPSPIVISKMGPAGQADDQYIAAYRYQTLLSQLQKTMLSQGDMYTALEGEPSRADVLKQYQAYASSFKRTRATNLKTEAGVQRELAEAQSMILDVDSEIMKVNKSITGLLSILAIDAADEMADEF